MYEGSDFSATLSAFVIVCFYLCHPSRYRMVYHCGSDLHFLMTNDVEHLLTYLSVTWISSLVKRLFKANFYLVVCLIKF